MGREKYSAIIILAVLIGIIVLFYLFTPRPIVEDVDNVIYISISYNPYFDQEAAERHDTSVPADRVLVVDDDSTIVYEDDRIMVTSPDGNHLAGAYKIIVADYDEKEVLECLSRYKEYFTLSWNNGLSWLGDTEIEIMINTYDDLKFIRLGNKNYISRGNGSFRYKIQEAEKLRAELLDMIDMIEIIDIEDVR